MVDYSYGSTRMRAKMGRLNYIVVKFRSIGKNWREAADSAFVEQIDGIRTLYEMTLDTYNSLRTFRFSLEKHLLSEDTFWASFKDLESKFPMFSSGELNKDSLALTGNSCLDVYEKVKTSKDKFRNIIMKLKDVFKYKDKLRNNCYKKLAVKNSLENSNRLDDNKRNKLEEQLKEFDKKVYFYCEKIISEVDIINTQIKECLSDLVF